MVITGYSSGGVRFFHAGNGTELGSAETGAPVHAVKRSGQVMPRLVPNDGVVGAHAHGGGMYVGCWSVGLKRRSRFLLFFVRMLLDGYVAHWHCDKVVREALFPVAGVPLWHSKHGLRSTSTASVDHAANLVPFAGVEAAAPGLVASIVSSTLPLICTPKRPLFSVVLYCTVLGNCTVTSTPPICECCSLLVTNSPSRSRMEKTYTLPTPQSLRGCRVESAVGATGVGAAATGAVT